MKIGRYLKAVFALFMVCILTISASGCTKANKEKKFYDLKYVWSCDELTIDLTQYEVTQEAKHFLTYNVHQKGTFPFVLQVEGEEKVEGRVEHQFSRATLIEDDTKRDPITGKALIKVVIDVRVMYSEKLQDYYLVVGIDETNYEGKHSGKVLILTHE